MTCSPSIEDGDAGTSARLKQFRSNVIKLRRALGIKEMPQRDLRFIPEHDICVVDDKKCEYVDRDGHPVMIPTLQRGDRISIEAKLGLHKDGDMLLWVAHKVTVLHD